MDTKLFERYVDAVKTYLPGGTQDDIGRELLDDLYSRVEAQEARLGRPLTNEEQEDVLRHMGNPALVAGRYSPGNRSVAFGRQIIGPGLFSLYIRVLLISLVVAFAARTLAWLLLGAPDPSDWISAVAVHFAIVTAIFAAVQYQLNRYPERWNPRDPLNLPEPIKDPQRVSRVEVILEVVFGAVFVLLLGALAPSGHWAVGPFVLAPIWHQLYWPVLVLMVISLVPPAIVIFKPRWLAFRFISRVLYNVAWLALLIIFFLGGPWVIQGDPVVNAGAAVNAINQLVRTGLLITVLITVAQVALDLYRLFRLWRRRPASLGGSTAAVY